MFTKRMLWVLAVVAVGMVCWAGAAQAAIIKVDNNDAGAAPDATWNTIAAPGSGISVVDSLGNDDGVTVTYSGWTDSSFSGVEGAYDGGVFDNAADDYFFGKDTKTVTISGLLDSETYTIQLCGSTNNTGSVLSDFKVNGSFGDGVSPLNGDDFDVRGDGYDAGKIMTYSGVSPSSGNIVITSTYISGQNGYFDAFTIEGNFVPEPATMALLGLGGLGVLLGRKRR